MAVFSGSFTPKITPLIGNLIIPFNSVNNGSIYQGSFTPRPSKIIGGGASLIIPALNQCQESSPDIIFFRADPVVIISGSAQTSSVLSWQVNSISPVTVLLDQGIGIVSSSDFYSVSPTSSTTYTLSASNNLDLTASMKVTVAVVNFPPQILDFSVTPSSYVSGAIDASALLSWNTRYANFVSINQGIGSVGISGSSSINPNITTTYILTVSGSGGTGSYSTTLTVTPARLGISIQAISHTIVRVTFNQLVVNSSALIDPDNYVFTPHLLVSTVTPNTYVGDVSYVDLSVIGQSNQNYSLAIQNIEAA